MGHKDGMLLTFAYAPDLTHQLCRERRLRRGFWFICAAVVWILATLIFLNDPHWVAPVVALAFSALFLIFEWRMNQFSTCTIELLNTHLIFDGSLLQQIDTNRNAIAEIQIDEPFEAGYNRHTLGNAVYTVSQYGRANPIRFSSRIDGAEQLAREILKLDEWPPGAHES